VKKWISLILALTFALTLGSAALADGYEPGDSVLFGHYGDEEIEWYVLEDNGTDLFLMSRYALDKQPFNNTSDRSVTWETSAVREWLNQTFYHSAFTKKEREFVRETKVDDTLDSNSSKWVTAGRVGTYTNDHVFLLSYAEVMEYLSDKNLRMCVPSSYALKQGGNVSDKKYLDYQKTCWYWLRSSAYKANAGVVDWNGNLETCYMHHSYGVVRPCIWVDRTAVKAK